MGYGKERPCKKCGETRLIQARGLCQKCYTIEKNKNGLTDYPSGRKSVDKVVTMGKKKFRAEWELFQDADFFGMYAVREKGDTDVNSPRLFYFVFKKDAEEFKRLVELSRHAVRI